MKRRYFVYDLEVYPNIFIFAAKCTETGQKWVFEISDRKNQIHELIAFLSWLRTVAIENVGFNNIGYDYPIVHELITNPYQFSYEKAYQLSAQIIHNPNRNFNPLHVRHSERYIPQIDLLKLNHFDNDAKRTSLKALQFAMRSESLEDLPFKIRPLTDEEKDKLIEYCFHDIDETHKFLIICEPAIEMRREYIEDGTLVGDVLNYSDVKIGTEYLITRIGRQKCYAGGRPRSTMRTHIEFDRIIFPKIFYRTEIFNEVIQWYRKQTYWVGKDNAISLVKSLAGLEFHFGVGGLHASADNKIFHSDEDYQIIDIDVAGMYVAVGIVNRLAPEHLGESFVTAYSGIQSDRKRYPKESGKNKALKLAGNGAYGNSNNAYSPLYDPKYTFTVTVNGQLQILQLVEMIDLIPDCELIQANTDGITVRILKANIHWFEMWCREWEKMTGLVLEEVKYQSMWIRDVNNYIAQKMDGKYKLKGAYWYPEKLSDYEGVWNKDFSNLASIKAAVLAITKGVPVEAAIRLVSDPFDFMLRYKATGDSRLFIGEDEQLKTVRYYVSATGQPMKKVAPPKGEIGQYKRANKIKDEVFDAVMKEIGKDVWDARIHTKNKSKYGITETAVQSGWKVRECNKASKFDWKEVDWNFYTEEAKKLIIGAK